MSQKDAWYNAEVGEESDKEMVRFNHGMRTLAYDPSFGQMIIFETVPVDSKDLKEYLTSLDTLEDIIKDTLEAIGECHMLMACTGSGYSDLFFAYGGKPHGFDASIRSLIEQIPNRMNVRVSAPRWDLFNALVKTIDG